MTIEQEQEAFNAKLPELIKTHKDEFVLFKDGNVIDFYDSINAAYSDGLRRFGTETFLVDQVTDIPTGAFVTR
jgi:hypothetical protein